MVDLLYSLRKRHNKNDYAPLAVVVGLLLMVGAHAEETTAPDTQQNAAEQDSREPASASESAPGFALNELRVLHNSLLTPLAISKLLYPYLGENKTFADIEAARAALEGEYHAKGYGTVYVDIPEQTIGADGIVRLSVTEATLQRPRITGARYFANGQIRAALPAAAEGTAPNLQQLQAQITALNSVTSDRVVQPVLKAGTEPGTSALELKVTDTLPLHGSVELNNQYTADTKPLRLQAALRYDDAFARQDSLALQYQTAPQQTSEVKVFAGTYIWRLPENNKLAFTYINSSTNVATLGDIVVQSKGKTYSALLLHTLEVSAERMASAQIGLSYKDALQNVLITDVVGLSTPISYTVLQAGYNWLARSEPRSWTWSNNLLLGIPGLSDSINDFEGKCRACKPNFVIWRSNASLMQALPKKFSTTVKLSGQYTPDSVVSNEQLLIGGANSIRGYLESEELGDVGLAASLELHAPNWLPEKWGWQVLPYVFYDWARVKFQQPLPGTAASTSLASIGVGLDLSVGAHVNGTLLYGDPLKEGSHTKKGEGRFQFSLSGGW